MYHKATYNWGSICPPNSVLLAPAIRATFVSASLPVRHLIKSDGFTSPPIVPFLFCICRASQYYAINQNIKYEKRDFYPVGLRSDLLLGSARFRQDLAGEQ
jgi:hypothetical protein